MNEAIKHLFPHTLIEAGNSFIIASGTLLSFDDKLS